MRHSFIVVLCVWASSSASAQPGDPGGGGKPGVPITGIEYLLGAGGLFGARKLIRSFRHRSK